MSLYTNKVASILFFRLSMSYDSNHERYHSSYNASTAVLALPVSVTWYPPPPLFLYIRVNDRMKERRYFQLRRAKWGAGVLLVIKRWKQSLAEAEEVPHVTVFPFASTNCCPISSPRPCKNLPCAREKKLCALNCFWPRSARRRNFFFLMKEA